MKEITFEDINQANVGLTSVNVKGKEYVVVPQRVKAFRKLYPQGFISTEILRDDGETVVMRAFAGYYTESGQQITLGTGTAFETKDSSYINKTSYIENCETSAIGRALGFLGFGIDGSIASAEELINAINNQGDDQPPRQVPSRRAPAQARATVTTGGAVPPAAEEPVTGADYLKAERAKLAAELGPDFDFGKARHQLIANGEIEPIPSDRITILQAQEMVRLMRERFGKKAN